MAEQLARRVAAPLRPPAGDVERHEIWRTAGVQVLAARWDRERNPETSGGCPALPSVVLVRSGCFTLRSAGRVVVGDTNSATFYNAGQEFAVSHPRADRAACLTFRLMPEAAESLLAGAAAGAAVRPEAPFHGSDAPVGAREFLLQHLVEKGVTAAGAARDRLLIDEAVVGLVRGAARPALGAGPVRRHGRSERANMARVAAAKEFITAEFHGRLGLDNIADAAGCSPFHLCRQFTRLTGMPMHRYLNRVRLRHAVGMIEGCDLTSVALGCGFSGHSHFTAAFRQEFGRVPSVIRSEAARATLLRRLAGVSGPGTSAGAGAG